MISEISRCAMAGHHHRVSIDHRQQPSTASIIPRNDPPEEFVDHGIAAMSEEIAHQEHVCRRQKHRDIAIGVGRSLRQRVAPPFRYRAA